MIKESFLFSQDAKVQILEAMFEAKVDLMSSFEGDAYDSKFFEKGFNKAIEVVATVCFREDPVHGDYERKRTEREADFMKMLGFIKRQVDETRGQKEAFDLNKIAKVKVFQDDAEVDDGK